MRKFTKRSVAVVAAGVIAVSGAGAAYAAWLLNGSGSASATAGKAAQLTVTGTAIDALVPGSTSNVTLKVTNPNKFPAKVTGVTFTNFKTEKAGCTGIVLTSTVSPKVPLLDATVLGEKTKDIVIPASVRMAADAPNACQEATFSFTTTLTAESAASDNVKSIESVDQADTVTTP
ncbi:hypothetical protein FB565_005880 [Actinoplanes lutulentus]|uniref:Ribosomally synthesized peptide with SipW-like signal peptide n=2 Tax=Actinoplanes lutulentus TaxID=1287878 RepID=A0A327Z671_9ACTN|nr:hypothetical protein [Actinoplanes lutulentus]MBB2946122.1 hypothetical protein [Actinoplanes lutulentus]RAK32812.1 hypothetical protein B0I29_113107 [Actinoplanes lutulentus]